MTPSATLRRSHIIAILLFLTINFVLLSSFHQIAPHQLLLFILLFLVWCSPGYLFAVLSSKGNSRRGPFFWIVALASGYHISSLVAVLFMWSFSVPSWVVVFILGSVLLTLFLIFHEKLRTDIKVFRFSRSGIDLISLAVILSLLLIFIFLVIFPHAQAGKASVGGVRYHDLISTVFFKHISITDELTRNIPPENPFFLGEKLNYYWLFYIFPSVVHSSLEIPLQEILFLLTWAIALITLFSILILIHAFSTRTSDMIMGVTPLLFAYSYDGALVLGNLQHNAQPLNEFTSVNIDAAARSYLNAPEIIGVYRGFVFDPHHMFAICLMILAFLLFRRILQKPSWVVTSAALFLVGGIAGYSAFVAYTAVTWIGIWLIVELVRGNASFLKDIKIFVSTLLMIIFYTIVYFRSPGLYDFKNSELDIAFVPKSSLFLLIDFGALLVLGLLGLILGIKKKDWRILPMTILLVVGFAQLLFTYFPEWPHDLSMKTGHSISIGLACLSAHFFSKQRPGTVRRRVAKLGFAFIILPALPTLAMDWYNLQQPQNSTSSTLITKEELQACNWVNRTLPKDAIVQSFPVRDGSAFYSLIPTFAERRTALGDLMHSRIFQGDMDRQRNRRKLINLLFVTESSELAWFIAQNLDINYIYMGPAERKLFPSKHLKFKDTNFFERIYANRLVRIFKLFTKPKSQEVIDSYDEDKDLSIVDVDFTNGFKEMWNENVWKSIEWSGVSGATLSLNTPDEFSGVLIFRIRAPKTTRLEVYAGNHFETIRIEPDWQWIEIDELSLRKGANYLQFILPNDATNRFLISEVFFFGRRYSL